MAETQEELVRRAKEHLEGRHGEDAVANIYAALALVIEALGKQEQFNGMVVETLRTSGELMQLALFR